MPKIKPLQGDQLALDELMPDATKTLSKSSGLKARISEVVEEFSVKKTVASANTLKQSAFGAVVEELRQVPGGNAALPENETEGKMLNARDTTAYENA